MKRFVLTVERDSVCAGDDIDAPHARRFEFEATGTLTEALSAIVGSGYLAHIADGKATWIVEASDIAVAVVAQQWKEPKFLVDPTSLIASSVTPASSRALFFRYWCQIDPDVVFECLKSGERLPDIFGRQNST